MEILNRVYDVNFFIEFFDKIPDKFWCTGKFTDLLKIEDKKYQLQHCAIGHCVAVDEQLGRLLNPLSTSLNELFRKYYCLSTPMAINDGLSYHYRQFDPKTRILAALYDIKIKQEATEAKDQINVIIDKALIESLPELETI